MRIAHSQLMSHLQKKLGVFYLIAGDECLLVQEAIESICEIASTGEAPTEKTIITAEAGQEWEKALYAAAHSLSLLASRKIILLNLSAVKFTQTIGAVLIDYAKRPDSILLFIIQTAPVGGKIEKATWFQALEQLVVYVPIWPIPAAQLPHWILQRAAKMGLSLTKSAAERLGLRVEGNLLAAAQEIEKIGLLAPTDTLDENTIDAIVTDSAHFDIFNLVESALAGHGDRALRILNHLAATKTEPTLILWALARELRLLADIQFQLKHKKPLAQLFQQHHIWEKRQPSIRAFLQRHNLSQNWRLLINSGKIDQIIKGTKIGNTWDELQQFVLKITGNAIISL